MKRLPCSFQDNSIHFHLKKRLHPDNSASLIVGLLEDTGWQCKGHNIQILLIALNSSRILLEKIKFYWNRQIQKPIGWSSFLSLLHTRQKSFFFLHLYSYNNLGYSYILYVLSCSSNMQVPNKKTFQHDSTSWEISPKARYYSFLYDYIRNGVVSTNSCSPVRPHLLSSQKVHQNGSALEMDDCCLLLLASTLLRQIVYQALWWNKVIVGKNEANALVHL